MIFRRSVSIRLLAFLLPMALLTVFTGCVLSCSAQNVESVEYHTEVSAEDLAIANECDGCQLSSDLSCGLPSRENLLPPSNDELPHVFASATLVRDNGSCSLASFLMPPPGYDPPLKRLFALRI